jgi:hypothetical protein
VAAILELERMSSETPPPPMTHHKGDYSKTFKTEEIVKSWTKCVYSFMAFATGEDVGHATKILAERLGRNPDTPANKFFDELAKESRQWVIRSREHPDHDRFLWTHMGYYALQWCVAARAAEPPPMAKTRPKRKKGDYTLAENYLQQDPNGPEPSADEDWTPESEKKKKYVKKTPKKSKRT